MPIRQSGVLCRQAGDSFFGATGADLHEGIGENEFADFYSQRLLRRQEGKYENDSLRNNAQREGII